MSGYLDSYGEGDQKREKLVRRIWLWGGSALLLAGILFFIFHFVLPNRAEQKRVERFFDLLAAREYQQAYALWGCTEASPCRDYPFPEFLEDWGAEAVPVAGFDVLDGETCGSGVIVDVDLGKTGRKKLWVERGDGLLGFPPPGATERCPQGNRIYDFVRNIRYRMHGRTFE